MACEVLASIASDLWPALLELRRFLASEEARDTRAAYLLEIGGTWTLSLEPKPASRGLVLALGAAQEETLDPTDGLEVFRLSEFLAGRDPFRRLPTTRDVLGSARSTLRLYLPLLIGGHRARLRNELFLVAHLAQTLDGRIACRNGHSQWISNEANLFHAHRLRALHDAVLVGARTVESDDPRLTPRHVAGDPPRRVILSASGNVVRRASEFQVSEQAGSLFVCREDAGDLPPLNGANEVVRIPAAKGLFDVDSLARVLVDRGVHSVFVEGGGRTISHFLDAGAIDVLHLHVAPRILGSGIPGFELPEVVRIDAGHELHMEHFTLDGELLFECRAKEPRG